MNTLWNFVASYLPPIRIDNELPPPSNLGQHHDRTTSRPTDAVVTRIRQLETLNNRLEEQVLTLKCQLEHIQANSSSTEMGLDRQTQANEVHRLRTPYAELANPVRTLESNGEELRSLKSFLTKTDGYSGQQIIQAVHDLNTEILQLAAAVSDEFPLSRRSPDSWKESHSEFIREAISDGMLALLRDGDHEGDPTIVQLAIQAWEVWCCRQVLDSFCAGASPEVDRFLNDVFREMQSSGKPFLVSRVVSTILILRTRTRSDDLSLANPYTYVCPACSIKLRRRCASLSWFPSIILSSLPCLFPHRPTPGSMANNTPDHHQFALPMPRLQTPLNASAYSLDDPSSRTGGHISGILAILALAGCTDERGVHNEPLRSRFGEKLSHITEWTEALARMLREGVSSAWFEVVVECPSVTPLARGKGRGQGTWSSSQTFDPATMENMYAGYGSEECGVLCTVAFGLSVVKRRKEGEAGRGQQPAYLDVKGEQGAMRSNADLLETTLLVKPKVLLESVKERMGPL